MLAPVIFTDLRGPVMLTELPLLTVRDVPLITTVLLYVGAPPLLVLPLFPLLLPLPEVLPPPVAGLGFAVNVPSSVSIEPE
jgi:hypothetical protein